jgi:peptidoglycan/LPS O-acetylase OafA/YrhL
MDSWIRSPNVLLFFWKRLLRIYPALVAVTLSAAFIIGPIFTRGPLDTYFSDPQFISFFGNLRLHITYQLPHVFGENHAVGVVNGSLWSLPVEFSCYITVAAAGVIGRQYIGYALVFIITALGAIKLHQPLYGSGQIVIYATDALMASSIMIFFFIGAAYRYFGVALKSSAALVMLVALVIFQDRIRPEFFLVLTWIFFPYCVLAFGLASTPILSQWGRFGDASYGMYLYAFPVTQMLLAATGGSIGLPALVSGVSVASIALGLGSWHAVEKHALRLKRGLHFHHVASACEAVAVRD